MLWCTETLLAEFSAQPVWLNRTFCSDDPHIPTSGDVVLALTATDDRGAHVTENFDIRIVDNKFMPTHGLEIDVAGVPAAHASPVLG